VGGRLWGHREGGEEKFLVNVGKIDSHHFEKSSWIEEQYRTAELVRDDFGGDIALMFSGGTDSEIVLRAFLKIGVRPRVVFIRFKGGYNVNDFVTGLQICDSLDIPMETIDFDVIDYYRSGEAAQFASEIQCRQIAYLTVYHHIKKLGMPAVMGGELLLRRHVYQGGSRWYYCFRENEDASAMRFSIKYGIPLVNEWFSYTPEMMLYYMQQPLTQWLITEKYNYKLASVSTKNRLLRTLMPELVKKVKTTGYERLLGFNGETYRELYKTHPNRYESSLDGIYVDQLFNKLRGEE
jgi:hypothetical protein